MKKLRLFMLMSIIVCCLAAFVGCGKPRLSKPQNVVADGNALVVTWDAVENASGYKIKIEGEEYNKQYVVEEGTACSIPDLGEGVYTIKVLAIGSGDKFVNSEWTKIEYTVQPDNGMKYTLIDNDTAYEFSGLGKAAKIEELVIESHYKGLPITRIGASALSGASRLLKVEIGENVTEIKEKAFYNCSKLEEVVFPENGKITSIGEYAFGSCRSLKEITIPDGITDISKHAFSYCRSLTSVTMSENVKNIAESAFKACSALQTVTIPDGVQQIGVQAFKDCEVLESVSIGKGVLIINEGAFEDCVKLTSVSFAKDSNLLLIGYQAFKNCNTLESIELPATLMEIVDEAFVDCASLLDVEMGSAVTAIGIDAFKNTMLWAGSENLVYIDTWLVDCKDKEATKVTIAEGTTGIAYGAFQKCAFTSIIIPDTVTEIGTYAFYRCQSLTGVQIGNGVKMIGERAFAACVKLQNLVFGNSVEVISSYAFQACKLLTKVDLPDSVKYIGTYAFEGSGLKADADGLIYAENWLVGTDPESIGLDIRLSNTTVGIAEHAFYKCENLSTISIPNSVQVIGDYAFRECTGLVSVNVPDGITEIGQFTFYKCASLISLKIPVGITSIGYGAFRDCTMLKQITVDGSDEKREGIFLPDGVTEIGGYAFYGCAAIPMVEFGEESQLNSIGTYAFKNCTGLETLTLPASLKEIGKHTFFGCASLRKLDLGGVQIIGERAFEKCAALVDLVIPDSVTEIGQRAFRECSNLITVKFGANVKTIGRYAFYKCRNIIELNLPLSVESIGAQAFAYLNELKSVTIGKGVALVDSYAFIGCNKATFYCEAERIPAKWGARWNSAYRPVLWGCKLVEENGINYVVSFTKNVENISNPMAKNGFSAPVRKGYTFRGWSLTENAKTADYTAEDFLKLTEDQTAYVIPEGTVLYAVWVKN